MNGKKLSRWGQLFAVVLAAFSIHSSANATPTGILRASCVWSGDDGSLLRQTCELVGNSSAGSGTSFYITWEDGTKTRLVKRPSAESFVSLPSGERTQIHGSYSFDRMGFPRQIVIEGKGTITVIYDE
jgi:hypothetical protein